MQNFVEKVLEALTQAGVEFFVVGGVSAVLQGVPVVTQDLDLCYRRTPDNVRRLAAALRTTARCNVARGVALRCATAIGPPTAADPGEGSPPHPPAPSAPRAQPRPHTLDTPGYTTAH